MEHTLDVSLQGERWVWAQLCDAVGNCTTSGSPGDSIVYDTVPPGTATGVSLALDDGAPLTRTPFVKLTIATGDAVAVRYGNTETLAGTEFVSVTTGASIDFQHVLPLGDGEKTVYAQFEDAAGNVSAVEPNPHKTTITLDTAAPTGASLRIVAGPYTRDDAFDVELTAASAAQYLLHVGSAEDFSGESWAPFTGSSPAWTMPVRPSFPAPATDGAWTVFVRFRDAAGNETATVSRPITRDTAPPQLPRVRILEAPFTRSQRVNLDLFAVDASHMRIAADGTSVDQKPLQPYAPSATVDLLPVNQGLRSVVVRFVDLAGNAAEAVTDRTTLDTDAASAVSFAIEQGDFTRSTSVTLQIAATGASAMRLSNTSAGLTSAAYEPFAGARSWTLLSGDGQKFVHLQLRDEAGNETGAFQAGTTLDTQAPTGSVSVPAFSQSATVSATVARGDTNTTRMALSQTFLDCSGASYGAFDATPPALALGGGDGPKTIYLCLQDAAGNTAGFSANVTVDTASPTGTLQIDGGAAFTTSTSGSVVLNIATDPDVVSIKAANGAVIDCSSDVGYGTFDPAPGHTLATGDGTRTVKVCVRDGSGRSTALTDTIQLDTQKPILGSPAVAIAPAELISGAVRSLDVTLNFNVSPDRAGEKLFMAVANGPALDANSFFLPYQTPYSHTLAAGPDSLARQVCALFKDEAGLLADVQCIPVAVDRTGSVAGKVELEGETNHSGAQIDLSNVADAGTSWQAFSTAAGDYTLNKVPGGTGYTLRISHAGFVEQVIRDVVVVTGKTSDRGTITLALPRASIAGTVTYVDKTAGQHMGIVISDASSPQTTVTAPNGTFLLTGLATNRTYNLSARFSGYVAILFTPVQDLVAGETRSLGTFTLQKQQGDFRICAGSDDDFCSGGAIGFTKSRTVLLDVQSPLTQWRISLDANFDGGTQAFQPFVSSERHGFTFAALEPDGAKAIHVQFKDGANPPEPDTTGVVTLDTTAPAPAATGAVIINPDASGVGATYSNHPAGAVNLALAASDLYSGVAAVRIANAATAGAQDFSAIAKRGFLPAMSHTLDIAAQGTRWVFVQFCDAVDNCTATAASPGDSIVYDTVPPGAASGVSLVLDAGAAVTGSPFVTARITTGDAVSLRLGNSESLLGSDFVAVTPEQTIDFPQILPLGDGVKTVYAQYRDAAGNLSPTEPNPHKDTILLDTLPPSGGNVEILSGAFTNQDAASVRMTAADAAQYQLHVGQSEDFSAESWLAFTGVSPLWQMTRDASFPAPLADGTWTVFARFRDEAGNVTSTYARSIVRDTAKPQFPRVSIDQGNFTRFQSVDLTLFAAGASAMIVAPDGTIDSEVPQTYLPAAAVLLPSGEGSRTVRVQFLDEAGNRSDTASDSITVDVTAPSAVTFSILEGDYARSAAVSLDIAATGASEMQVANNSTFAGSSWEPFAQSRAWTLSPGDGAKIVYLKLRDQAGNETGSFQDSITLDTSPPASPSLVLTKAADCRPGNGITRNPAITFTATASGASTVHISNDAGFATFSTFAVPATNQPFTLSTGQGQKTVYARFLDAAGNQAVVSAQLAVDTSAPTSPLLLIAQAPYTPTASVDLTLGAVGGPELMILVADTDAQSALARLSSTLPLAFATQTTLSLPSVADGTKYVAARFLDAACNESIDLVASTRLDTTKPTGSIAISGTLADQRTVSSISTASQSVSLALAASDASSAESMQVSSNSLFLGAVWEPYRTSIPWLLSAGDGSKTVYARFRDPAHNPSDTYEATITLDTTGPSSPSLVLTKTADCRPGNGQTRFTAITLSATATGADTVEVSNDQAFATFTTFVVPASGQTFTLTTGDGQKTVWARFKDAALNSALVSANLTLDTAAPTGVAVQILQAPATLAGAVDLALVASGGPDQMQLASADATSTAASVMLGVASPQPFSTSATAVPIPTSLQGVKWIAARFLDAACNPSADAHASITYDTSKPTGTIAINAGAARTSNPSVTITFAGVTADTTTFRLANDSVFSTSSFVPYPPSGGSALWDLTGADGTRTVYAQLKDAAGNVSDTVLASIALDTEPPTWTQALTSSADTVQPNASVTMTYGAVDNLDTAANLQIAFNVSNACGVYGPYGAGSASYQLGSTDGSHKIFACVKDRAGNVTFAPGPWPVVRVDSVPPSPPVMNLPLAIGGGVLLSWADPNDDTAYVQVDYSLDATFATGVLQAQTAPGSPPPTSLTIEGLANFRRWYFRARIYDRAGLVSTPDVASVAGTELSVIPGLGRRVFDDPNTAGRLSLVSDGPDLWAHYPITYAEVILHCKAGSKDCRDSSRWSSVTVPVAAFPNNVGGAPPAMAVTEQTLWFFVSGYNQPAGKYQIRAYSCARDTNCEQASNWKDVLVRESLTVFSPVAAAASGKYIALAYSKTSGASTTFSMTTCPRSDLSGCYVNQFYWIHLDTPIPVDTNQIVYRPTMIGTEYTVYGGFRAGGGFMSELTAGAPAMFRCFGNCNNAATATACSGINCGDIRFSAFDKAATDALPPVFAETSGVVMGAYSQLIGNYEYVKTRLCRRSYACADSTGSVSPHLYQFDPPVQVFPSTTLPETTRGSGRPTLGIAVTGRGASAGAVMRVVYPDTGARKLWLGACDPLGSWCDASTDWARTLVAAGGGADFATSIATMGQDFFFAGATELALAQIYLPLVSVPFGMFAGPQVGAIRLSWTPGEDASGTRLLYGPSAGPPWANSLVSNDPFAGSITLSGSTSADTFASAQSFSAAGRGDQALPWTARPFRSVAARTDLSPAMGVSLASAGPPGAGIANPYVYASALANNGGGAAISRYMIGRCATAGDCSVSGNWTWSQAIGGDTYSTTQLSADYPRNWWDGAVAWQTKPRLFAPGRYGGTSLYLEACDLASDPNQCVGGGWSDQLLGSVADGAMVTGRVVGTQVMTTESAADGRMLVRYCDGSRDYQNPCDAQCVQAGHEGLCVDKATNYCFNPANWKTVTLGVVAPGGATTGMPHPLYGWIAVQAISSLISVFTCPYTSYAGCNNQPKVDCSIAANWKEAWFLSNAASSMDITATSQDYFPIARANSDTSAVFLSFHESSPSGGGWRVATCRGEPDIQRYDPWTCQTASGWTTTAVAPALANPLASTVRVVRGDVIAAFVESGLPENGRILLAACAGGSECWRASSWRVVSSGASFYTDKLSGAGLLTPDSSADLIYLAYPRWAGNYRNIEFLTQGAFHGP